MHQHLELGYNSIKSLLSAKNEGAKALKIYFKWKMRVQEHF
jgi:hypothetical protein